jgi:hypothetical protein
MALRRAKFACKACALRARSGSASIPPPEKVKSFLIGGMGRRGQLRHDPRERATLRMKSAPGLGCYPHRGDTVRQSIRLRSVRGAVVTSKAHPGARGSSHCAIFERRRISVCHNPSSHGQGIITQCAKDIGYAMPPPLPQSGSKAYLYVVTRTADVAGKLAVCADSSSAAHLGCARETSSSSQIIPPP